MSKIFLSWIVNDRSVFQRFCLSVHRRKRLRRWLARKNFPRLVDVSWISEEQMLFDRFCMAANRMTIHLRRQLKGQCEKPNEPGILKLSNSSYHRRKDFIWFKKRLSVFK